MLSSFFLFIVVLTVSPPASGLRLLGINTKRIWGTASSKLFLSTENNEATTAKAAPVVTGEELEVMLTEWETPLVLDAYATWCGPCMIMAPEFEAAAKELKGRVRFAKLDTDASPEMASRLNIMGLPTLMFLNKYEGENEDEDDQPRATLLQRIEGAIPKDSIVALSEHLFFDGPMPEKLY